MDYIYIILLSKHIKGSELQCKALTFSILLKDTSTCGQEEQGIKLTNLRSVDDRLYLLRFSLLVFPGGFNENFQTKSVHIVEMIDACCIVYMECQWYSLPDRYRIFEADTDTDIWEFKKSDDDILANIVTRNKGPTLWSMVGALTPRPAGPDLVMCFAQIHGSPFVSHYSKHRPEAFIMWNQLQHGTKYLGFGRGDKMWCMWRNPAERNAVASSDDHFKLLSTVWKHTCKYVWLRPFHMTSVLTTVFCIPDGFVTWRHLRHEIL